jgi:hypothetical protein
MFDLKSIELAKKILVTINEEDYKTVSSALAIVKILNEDHYEYKSTVNTSISDLWKNIDTKNEEEVSPETV